MPEILINAAGHRYMDINGEFDRQAIRAVVVTVLRTLAGPERGRGNHILMTGNILHTLADLTEEGAPDVPQ